MYRRCQISLRLVLLAVFMVALALGLLRINIAVVHSVILAAFTLVLLGASIGWPVGYVFGRLRGAIVGGVCGVLFVFSALYVLVEVLGMLG